MHVGKMEIEVVPEGDSLFKYKAKNCKNVNSLMEGLQYYLSIKNQVPPTLMNNYEQVIESFKKRLVVTRDLDENTVMETLVEKDRIFYYHKCIILSVEFLQLKPDPVRLDQLFYCLTEAAKLAGKEWNEKYYSDNVVFHNAFTQSEKKISFINKIMESGLHKAETIISIINGFIKLVNMLQLKGKLQTNLPERKNLYDVSFVIPDFKY